MVCTRDVIVPEFFYFHSSCSLRPEKNPPSSSFVPFVSNIFASLRLSFSSSQKFPPLFVFRFLRLKNFPYLRLSFCSSQKIPLSSSFVLFIPNFFSSSSFVRFVPSVHQFTTPLVQQYTSAQIHQQYTITPVHSTPEHSTPHHQYTSVPVHQYTSALVH